RRVATDGYMRQFWAWSFLSPGSPSLVERLPLIARETLFPFFIGSRPHTLAVIVVVLAFWGVGAVGLGRRLGRWAMVLVAGPVVVALAASAVHGYPISARLMLYAAPLLMLMLAEGVVRGIGWLRRPEAGAARGPRRPGLSQRASPRTPARGRGSHAGRALGRSHGNHRPRYRDAEARPRRSRTIAPRLGLGGGGGGTHHGEWGSRGL